VDPRARELIQRLGLEPHPEGGHYREVFRSPREVQPTGPKPGDATRSAITTIYFLLVQDEPSAWHSVMSDEIWHFLEGAALELRTVDPERLGAISHRVGPLGGDGTLPAAVVQAGHWQMARTLGAYTLAACTVGPGFDFADFKLLRDDPEMAKRFRREVPPG
jgi:uncharacterized protein